MPSVSQADLAFTAQILYPPFRTYGNSFQETYREMHLISRNGLLPLHERLQVLFILIFLFLLFCLDLFLHPTSLSAACHKPSLHPRKGKACWQLSEQRNNAPLSRLLQATQLHWVGVGNKCCYVVPTQAVLSWWSIMGRLGCSHSLACVHWGKGLV